MFCPIIKGKCPKDCVFKFIDGDCLLALYIRAHIVRLVDESDTNKAIKDAVKGVGMEMDKVAKALFGHINDLPPELKQQIEEIFRKQNEDGTKQS